MSINMLHPKVIFRPPLLTIRFKKLAINLETEPLILSSKNTPFFIRGRVKRLEMMLRIQTRIVGCMQLSTYPKTTKEQEAVLELINLIMMANQSPMHITNGFLFIWGVLPFYFYFLGRFGSPWKVSMNLIAIYPQTK